MPAELWEDQYELSPADSTVEDGFVFGTEDTGYLTLERPTHAGGEVQANDGAPPYEDGTRPGRDYRTSKTTAFVIGVLTDLKNLTITQMGTPLRTNLNYLDYMEGRWYDERLRDTASARAMLRTCEGGRTSRAYGRPRRYEEAAGRLTKDGYTPVVCDFVVFDNKWYDDDERSMDLSLIVEPDGGFEVPFEFPLIVAASEGSGTEVMSVGGTVSTWMVADFHGPCTNPEVRIGTTRIGLRASLAYDEIIRVDTRPWRRSVLRLSDSASFAGDMSPGNPLMRDTAISPGEYVVDYTATDPTGLSHVTLRWRDARNRP